MNAGLTDIKSLVGSEENASALKETSTDKLQTTNHGPPLAVLKSAHLKSEIGFFQSRW
jgi:hypothetical protein